MDRRPLSALNLVLFCVAEGTVKHSDFDLCYLPLRMHIYTLELQPFRGFYAVPANFALYTAVNGRVTECDARDLCAFRDKPCPVLHFWTPKSCIFEAEI